MSTPFWRPWRDETRADPVDEQLAAEAARAVRDFRTRQLPVMAPASGKLTREMALKAWNHVYEPRPRLPVHPDEYARMKKEAEEAGARMMPVLDLEADSYAVQMRWYMKHVERPRWISWYEPPISDHHEEPPSRPHFVITRLDE